MNANIGTMDELLKKKRSSSSKSQQFLEAWKGFVLEHGFSEEAEKYLYDGSVFCGAEPFYWYLNQTDDQNKRLKELFNGSSYGKDGKATLRMLTHLFALLLNKGSSSETIALIIEQLSTVGGYRTKDAMQTMKKYFFDVLLPTVEFTPLSTIDLDQTIIFSFASDLLAGVGEIRKDDSVGEPALTNTARVCEWLGAYLCKDDGVKTVMVDNTAAEKSASPSPSSDKLGKNDGEKSTDVQAIDLKESFSGILDRAKVLYEKKEKELVRQRVHSQELEFRLSDAEQGLLQEYQKNKELQNTTQELRVKISHLERLCNDLNKVIAEKEDFIAQKNQEIEERMKMSEALSLDRSRQFDEKLQRIASALRVEYRDFQDAKQANMTVELGENLLVQLENIFGVLEKAGLKIQ